MSDSGRTGGLGVGTVLTIVFVVLKLVGTIDWSWWWVLSPLWIGFFVCLLWIIIAALVISSNNKHYKNNYLRWKD